MFTGIIECLGTITRVRYQGTSVILRIRHDMNPFTVMVGGSVAVDGICLTLEEAAGNEMQFSAVAETLHRSTLHNAVEGRRVNLERALRVDGRLEGHFVYGHVDATADIIRDREMRGSIIRTFSLPQELSPYIAEKGSIAIDGISLTICHCDATTFDISFIPHTLKHTTMVQKKSSDSVNIECDIIARYLNKCIHAGYRLKHDQPATETLANLMERSGF